jgi:hypothetical protein
MSNCKRCGYEWQSRVSAPVACPRCKRYLIEPRRLSGLGIPKRQEFQAGEVAELSKDEYERLLAEGGEK